MFDIDDSKIPESIRKGCKTPQHVVVRALAAAVLGLLWIFVMSLVKGKVTSILSDFRDIVAFVWLIVLCATFYKYTPRVWGYLRENLRDCTIYHKFKQFYRQHRMLQGSTHELAMHSALEKVEHFKRMRRRQHGRRSGSSGVTLGESGVTVSF